MMKRTGHVGLETLGPPALGGLLLANRGGRDGTREGGDGDDGLGVHFGCRFVVGDVSAC